MTNERLITLLYNAIICLEEYGCDGEQLEIDLGITEEEYAKIILQRSPVQARMQDLIIKI